MASSNNSSEDEIYIKAVLKKLSKEKCMDKMRESLQQNGEYRRIEEIMKHKLEQIIEPGCTKSYEDIFIELGGLTDDSRLQNLEPIIKKVAEERLRNMSDESKERIFEDFDCIEEKYRNKKH